MKPLFLILLCFLFFSFGGDKRKNDLERNKLMGKVKSVIESNYRVKEKSGKMQKDSLIMASIGEYNEKGNETVDSNYWGSERELNSISKNIYDKDDKLIERDFYNNQGNSTGKIIYEFDEKGSKAGYREYVKNGFGNDNLTRIDSLKYDTHDNVIKEEGYPITRNDEEFHGYVKAIYKYDNYDREIETRYFGSDTVKTTTKYNKGGNAIAINTYSINDSLISTRTCRYFDYDKKGNWLRSISYKNGKPISIQERVIEYYP